VPSALSEHPKELLPPHEELKEQSKQMEEAESVQNKPELKIISNEMQVKIVAPEIQRFKDGWA
jgi:hypothetical protein